MKRDAYLHYATPESRGVPSSAITDYLLAIGEAQINLHSFILMKEGDVIAEGYYQPYNEMTKHRMYSMTKSFTALAIGMLQDEGKLDIHDKIADYFPEYLPENPDPYLTKATIQNLLMMSSPQSYTTYTHHDPDFVRTFFETKPSHPAGTIFSYDTSASDVLAALVNKLSGKPMIEYMKDRGLREMGFSEDAATIQTPEGHSSGGSGLLCTPRDLARVGQMLLDNGEFYGKRILSEAYVKDATAWHEDTNFRWTYDPTECEGYGYFIWRTRNNSYSFLGMGDQFVTVIPEKKMVFVATADDQYVSMAHIQIMDLLWKHIIDHVSDDVLKVDEDESALLASLLENLKIETPDGEDDSPFRARIDGKTFAVHDTGATGLKSFRFDFNGEEGVFSYDTTRGKKRITFGVGHYSPAELDEPQYYGRTFGKPVGRPYRAIAGVVWPMEKHLILSLNVLDDHIGNALLRFSFLEDGRVSCYWVSHAEWFLNEYDGMFGGEMVD